jgi:hypothetical protein
MSQAVLRLRNQYIVEPALPIETAAEKKVLREVDLPSAYIELMYEKAKASASDPNQYARKPNLSGIFVAAIIGTAFIIIGGLVVGYLWPGPAGIILPVGLGLWWLLYKLADRYDQLV